MPFFLAHDKEDQSEFTRGFCPATSAATVDLELANLRVMYRLAVKRKKILHDALPGEFVMNGEVNPRRIVTDEEFQTLHHNTSPEFADVLLCGYESAMRSSEICNLKAKQVHLDELIREVPRVKADYIDSGIFDTKNKTRRTVPVSPALKEVLARRLKGLAPDDRVFAREDGKHFYNNGVSDRLRTLCKNLGIPYGDKAMDEDGNRIGIVFHCLRHTRTTKWVEAGFSDEVVRRATGHKSLESYQRYVKAGPAAVMMLVGKGDRNEHTRTNEDVISL